jgi:hypothetical protein
MTKERSGLRYGMTKDKGMTKFEERFLLRMGRLELGGFLARVDGRRQPTLGERHDQQDETRWEGVGEMGYGTAWWLVEQPFFCKLI